MVTPEPLGLLVLRGPSVPVAHLVFLALMETRESLVLLELLVPLDPREQLVCPVSVVLPALLDLRVRRVRLDIEDWRAMLEEMVPVVLLDPVDPLDPLVLMVTRVRLAHSVLLDPLVLVVLLESVVSLALLDLPDLLDPLVLMARPDREVRKDLLVEKVTLDLPALLALLAILDLPVLLALLVHLVPVVTLVPLV